jgi:type I restriction enzyme S subunit
LLQKLVDKRNLLVRKGAIRKSTIEENEQTVRQISNSTEIPASWSWVNLKQLGYFLGGKTPSKNKSVYWNGNIPWVSPKDMKSLAIKDSEDHVTQLGVNTGLAIIPTNSILMVVRSGILKRAFPVAINKIDCTINQDLKGLVPFSTEITPYLQLMFRGFETNILSKLTKQGVTVESVKFEEFVSIQFPIPPLLEQNRIVDKVNHLMQLCDNLNQQIDVALQIQGEVLGAVMGKVV